MKNARHLLTILMFCFCSVAQTKESARFQLDLNRPPPKSGDEIEEVTSFRESTSITMPVFGRQISTNRVVFLELKDKARVLRWDKTNNLGEVELTVDHFLEGNSAETNAIIEHSSVINSSSIFGETFFKSKNGHLSEKTDQALNKIAKTPIRNTLSELKHIIDNEVNYNAIFETEKPRAIGESWKASPKLIEKFIAGENRKIKIGTNSIKAVVSFLGTTNLFGFDCFHLQTQLQMSLDDAPSAMKALFSERLKTSSYESTTIVDQFLPFISSQKQLAETVSINISYFGQTIINNSNFVVQMKGSQFISSHRRFILPFNN